MDVQVLSLTIPNWAALRNTTQFLSSDNKTFLDAVENITGFKAYSVIHGSFIVEGELEDLAHLSSFGIVVLAVDRKHVLLAGTYQAFMNCNHTSILPHFERVYGNHQHSRNLVRQ